MSLCFYFDVILQGDLIYIYIYICWLYGKKIMLEYRQNGWIGREFSSGYRGGAGKIN